MTHLGGSTDPRPPHAPDVGDVGGGRAPTELHPAPGLALHHRADYPGDVEPTHLVQRADGSTARVGPRTAAVLGAILGTPGRSAHEVALDVESAVDAAEVQELVATSLVPAGLVVDADGDVREPRREASGPRARRHLLSATRVRAMARFAAPLTAWPVLAVAGACFLMAQVVLLATTSPVALVADALARPSGVLALVALTLLGGLAHEAGHAGALHRAGGRPGELGAGLVLVWPALYTDVTDAYRLSRSDRLRVDVAGIGANALVGSLYAVGGAMLGSDLLTAAALLQLPQVLQQLLPIARFDGHLIVADLAGVPDLSARIPGLLRSLVPGRDAPPEVTALTPRARCIATAWTVGVVVLIGGIVARLVVSGPAILGVAGRRILDRASTAADAAGRLDVAGAVAGALTTAVAAIVPIGIVLVALRLGRRGMRAARRRAGRGSRTGPGPSRTSRRGTRQPSPEASGPPPTPAIDRDALVDLDPVRVGAAPEVLRRTLSSPLALASLLRGLVTVTRSATVVHAPVARGQAVRPVRVEVVDPAPIDGPTPTAALRVDDDLLLLHARAGVGGSVLRARADGPVAGSVGRRLQRALRRRGRSRRRHPLVAS